MVSLPPAEAYTVQALMDLALPRFAGLGDEPRQVHAPWAMSTDSPASLATSRLDTSGEEDRAGLASPCLDLDGLPSPDDDIGTLDGLSDLSATLLCGSDEVFAPVNSDQVLSDVDFPQSLCRTISDRLSADVMPRRSARLLYRSPTFWVDQLGKEQAMAAAVNLQRDAGIMLSNLQILSQFATSLSRMSSEMMDLGIGQTVFPVIVTMYEQPGR